MAAFTKHTISHPLLGQITGRKDDNLPVFQYLGVKYASTEGRFTDSHVFEGPTSDATRSRNICPQVPNSLEIEQSFIIQKALVAVEELPSALEEECLNLNITVPQDFKGLKKLPVLVWIHGGGFLFGAGSWPHTDMGKLVALGQEITKPFIGVSINYRTGPFGFLASSELREFGSHGNFGIKDQINAFLWIQKFIEGFGGDPNSVTAIGQSCGGVSATLLLHYPQPLFRRVVSMGGHALLMSPIDPAFADKNYEGVIASLGLTSLSPRERFERLRTMPADEIVAKVPRTIPNRPVIDGHLFKTMLTAADVQDPINGSSIPGKDWCAEILIGDCQSDGYIMSSAIGAQKEGLTQKFINSLERSLSHHPELKLSLFSDYKITKETSDDDAFHKIVAIITDLAFYKPTTLAIRGWPRADKRYLYHFNAGNPFPGPLQGKASHTLDVAYFFQNYNDDLPESEVRVAQDFAKVVIGFVKDGTTSWKPWSESATEQCGVFGKTSPDSEFDVEGTSQRRPYILKAVYDFDILWGAIQNFLGGN